jgi:hypothetical protein
MSESTIQNKIISIEKFILKLPELNVRAQIKANNKKIDMRIPKRVKYADGFYLVTVESTESECHAVMIYRETVPGITSDDEKIIFYIFDPNGKTSAKAYGYESNITFNKAFEIDFSMTPEKSINESGRCALWCIILITLWNSFAAEKRIVSMSLVNSKMRESLVERTKFIESIVSILKTFKDFTLGETKRFIQQLQIQITNLQIHF